MNIHWIQHVAFEGLGSIELWFHERGHSISCSRLWAGDPLPAPEKTRIDGLIVMGGPMGVHDETIYSWLAAEKDFIQQMIDLDKPVLGICLGAQLIAKVLGANVWSGKHKEIGFFPLTGGSASWANQTVFHWHGDTFAIPEGAVRLASSEATENQAFLYKTNVLALQFHLEMTESGLRELYQYGVDEVVSAPFIQNLNQASALRFANGDLLETTNALMEDVLEELFRGIPGISE